MKNHSSWRLEDMKNTTTRLTITDIERYNRTVRYDWLAHHLFDSIDQVQDFATRWLWSYNHERPNMALGGITPIQKLAMAA